MTVEHSPCYVLQEIPASLFEGLELETLEENGFTFDLPPGSPDDRKIFLRAPRGFPFGQAGIVVDVFQTVIKRSGGKIPYVCIEGAYATPTGDVYHGSHGGFAAIITADNFEFLRTGVWLAEKMQAIDGDNKPASIPARWGL